uniref:Uncharacterized protein n=1 Tax=Oryza rufipogon TaxID=4529 RepID=A0A0E0QVN5_ORYRU
MWAAEGGALGCGRGDATRTSLGRTTRHRARSIAGQNGQRRHRDTVATVPVPSRHRACRLRQRPWPCPRRLLDSFHSSWVRFRVAYITPLLQLLVDACVVLLLVQSADRLVQCLGCLYIHLNRTGEASAAGTASSGTCSGGHLPPASNVELAPPPTPAAQLLSTSSSSTGADLASPAAVAAAPSSCRSLPRHRWSPELASTTAARRPSYASASGHLSERPPPKTTTTTPKSGRPTI